MLEHTVVIAERLDQLATRLYGSPLGYVETILDLNPGLALEGKQGGFVLASGRVINIPALITAPEAEVIRLWT